jgi:CPA1 family monovalent cation:H+ antiporter
MSTDQIGIILVISCVVAIICRRLSLPYTVGLVTAGIALALLGGMEKLELTPHLIFEILLPPLLFEAALHLKWEPFRRNLPVSLSLAFPGTILTAAIVAVGMHFALHWSWLASGLFGALISATDPVSVIAAFKELKVEPRLALLVESESLLNDGAAAVGFAILVALAEGASLGLGSVLEKVLWMVAGGIAVGAVVSGACLLLAGQSQDALVEIALTTIAAYGSFLAAEHLHMSGVLAAVTAGLMIGNIGRRGVILGRERVLAFWEYAAFLANSVVFILIGGDAAHQRHGLLGVVPALAILLVLIGQALAVYPFSALFARTSLRLSMPYQHVMVWGGLRGAISLALALSIPDSLPEKHAIIAAAFAVVAFSIYAQGLTMPWLIRRLNLSQIAAAST